MNMKSTLPTAFKRLLAVSAMAMIGTAALAQADAPPPPAPHERCLLYTSDAADE